MLTASDAQLANSLKPPPPPPSRGNALMTWSVNDSRAGALHPPHPEARGVAMRHWALDGAAVVPIIETMQDPTYAMALPMPPKGRLLSCTPSVHAVRVRHCSRRGVVGGRLGSIRTGATSSQLWEAQARCEALTCGPRFMDEMER